LGIFRTGDRPEVDRWIGDAAFFFALFVWAISRFAFSRTRLAPL
jgi:hypothetical protein